MMLDVFDWPAALDALKSRKAFLLWELKIAEDSCRVFNSTPPFISRMKNELNNLDNLICMVQGGLVVH